MSQKDILSYFGSELRSLHPEDLYFVLSILLPKDANIDKFVARIVNEEAKI